MALALGCMGGIAGVEPWTLNNAIWSFSSFVVISVTIGVTKPHAAKEQEEQQ